MKKEQKEWHSNFLSYMEMISNHPNYKGLAIEKDSKNNLKWIATAKSDIGKKRVLWANTKIQELNLKKIYGVYAELMLEIHPTKEKVCQTCGKTMSIFYIYLNKAFAKKINRDFSTEFTECDSIYNVWDELKNKKFSDEEIKKYFVKYFNFTDKDSNYYTKEEIIKVMEYACRVGNKKALGPGAMSNFPDRFDGFHTYNRCCRSTHDKGRSKENLKSYTKDRRAYEYWSDGNIHAANQFMGSSYFNNTTADHILPISLGFVHDSNYIKPMSSSDNSSKRDRLLKEDIDLALKIYNKTNISPISWFSKYIWKYIVENYKKNINLIPTTYRNYLKQNMTNYMFILWNITNNCGKLGIKFLEEQFLENKYNEYFQYTYEFNKYGTIIKTMKRNKTERSKEEYNRFKRVALESIDLYHLKNNRNLKNDLTKDELKILDSICKLINNKSTPKKINNLIYALVEKIQKRILQEIKKSD